MSMRAAAVCYRRTSQRVEFLLVRTRSRRAWTFPKGHIERGESAVQAAAREAKEEAAASGRIDPKPFTRYRYPAWTGSGLPADVCVEAYLMEVADIGHHRRAERPMAWLQPEAAAKKLAEGRGPGYAREHRRVIREAVARLVDHPPQAERRGGDEGGPGG
jgi:8-oxo-dGTP pyrophosphatase MutT (NUDIX family)